MKKIILSAVFILSCFLHEAQSYSEFYTDGKVYVKWQPDLFRWLKEDPHNIPVYKVQPLSGLLQKYGITKIQRPFYQAGDDARLPFVLRIDFSKFSEVESFIRDLQQIKGIDYAEKVPLMKTDAIPNEGIPTHLSQINAANAWNVFNGNSNITVAIVDNACMWTHADLVQNTYTNTAEIPGNNLDDDANGYIDDVNGYDVSDLDNNPIPTNNAMDHGTHCAGIAAGRTDNNTGIASIGWNIKFIPVKCQTNLGATTVVANGYEGIIYSVKAKARIISCSWGNAGSSQTEQSVIDYAWNRGSIIIASAGNLNSSTPNYPGAYNNVYCVAAINSSDIKSSYSNYGTWVDVSAPGDLIPSTVPYNPTNTPTYVNYSGTSMATPMVAGLAGLMLSKSPNMTPTDVLNCISNTAVNIYTLTGNASYVTNNLLGAGRIEAFQAMNCAATYSALPPIANFYAFPLNTCTSTPVQFTDSSLYAPTSWSWAFQGGSPATSTLVNPSVQWSAPGTYSVSLTVSNASGNNTKTKISYITVAGPQGLPFAEGFQATQFLPTGWTPNNIYNDNIYWTRKTGVGGFGTSTACAVFDNYNLNAPNERDEMRSPKFSFNNVTSARLRFDVAYARYNAFYSDTLEVKLSSNCGATWTSIYLKGGSALSTAGDQGSPFVPSSTQWRRDTIDISALTAGQGNVMFSFINRGHYGQPIYLDNINLAFPTPSVALASQSVNCVNSPHTFSGTVLSPANYSWSLPGATPSTASGPSATVSYTAPGAYIATLTGVNGPTVATYTVMVTVNALPTLTVNQPTICNGSTATLSASGATNYIWTSSTGTIGSTSSVPVNPSALSVYTVYGNNGAANGSCQSAATTTVTVLSTPTVAATNQSVCSGGTATLSASGANSYQWTSGPATASIIINPSTSGTFIYTVTGTSNSCSDTETVSLTVAQPVLITLNASAPVTCSGDPVTITALGASNYTWMNNSNGANVTVNPTSTTNYSVTGVVGQCTGTAQITASVIAAPQPTITAVTTSTICAGDSVNLSASGAVTYSWNTGETASAIFVKPVVSTVYTLTGINAACSRTTTHVVTVVPSTVIINLSGTSTTLCAGKPVTLTATGANSYTWNTTGTGSVLTVFPGSTTTYSVKGLVNGCAGNAMITLTVHPFPSYTLNPVATSCAGSCDGAINFTSLDNAAYTYSVLNSSCPSATCPALCAGVYQTFATNSAGCSTSWTTTVTSPAALSLSLNVQNATCPTCADGTITATINGGTAPYTYTWSPATATSNTLSSVVQGCYTVMVADANGCMKSASDCVGAFTDLDERDLTNGLSIFPNPASEKITIKAPSQFSYFLVNSLGQQLQSGSASSECEVNLGGYAKGIYFIELSSKGATVRKKLLVQ